MKNFYYLKNSWKFLKIFWFYQQNVLRNNLAPISLIHDASAHTPVSILSVPLTDGKEFAFRFLNDMTLKLPSGKTLDNWSWSMMPSVLQPEFA